MVSKKYVLALLCLTSLSMITFETKAEEEEEEEEGYIQNPYVIGGLATFVVGSLWSAYRWAWKGRTTWAALLPDPVRVIFDGFLKAFNLRAPYEPAPVYQEQEDELTRNIKRLKTKRSKLSDPRILVKRLLLREIKSILDQIEDLKEAHVTLQQQQQQQLQQQQQQLQQQQPQQLQQVLPLEQSLVQFQQELQNPLRRDIMTIRKELSTMLKNSLAQNTPLINLQKELLLDLQQNVNNYPQAVLNDLNVYLNNQFQQLPQLQQFPHQVIQLQIQTLNAIFNRVNPQYPAQRLELLRLISLQELITTISAAIDAIKE